MPSENAQAVANEVAANVQKGLKVNKGEIIKKQGYSKSVSLKPQKVTETQSYKEAMIPVIELMREKRDKALKAITDKKLDKAGAKELTDVADKMTKNMLLLSGESTEKSDITFSWKD